MFAEGLQIKERMGLAASFFFQKRDGTEQFPIKRSLQHFKRTMFYNIL